jgi:hypothetical protein
MTRSATEPKATFDPEVGGGAVGPAGVRHDHDRSGELPHHRSHVGGVSTTSVTPTARSRSTQPRCSISARVSRPELT